MLLFVRSLVTAEPPDSRTYVVEKKFDSLL
jgi:hypothetical protein